MRHTTTVLALLAIGSFLMVPIGCGESEDPASRTRRMQEQAPPDPKAATPESPEAPAADGQEVRVAGLAWDAPEGWAMADSPSPMRKATLRVGGEGDDAVEAVFFHFGQGQGGDADANLARWARQVLGEDGEPVQPEIEVLESDGGVRTVLATYRGTYQSGMPGQETTPEPGSTLLGAVIEGGPAGSVFVRLVGPSSVVDEAADEWRSMLSTVRVAADG